jgi:hypothetical protein
MPASSTACTTPAYDVGVALSFNLTGPAHLSQTAACSDMPPARIGQLPPALLTPAFIPERFRFIEVRPEVPT